MGTLGPLEIFLIFLAILLIFGAKRIPEIARGMGKGIREFRSATKEISEELTLDEPSQRIQPPRPTSQPAATPRTESGSQATGNQPAGGQAPSEGQAQKGNE